ncbi:MAG: potassium transporter TrkG, partial [Mucinivorans sp.]
MNIATVIRYTGMVLLLNAAFMLISAFISLVSGVDTAFYPLLLSFLITTIIGLFPLIFVPNDPNLTGKEGYIIVIASWIMSCAVGTLPYLIWGGEFSLSNAWFESTSGFTTTGSTILANVEALPRGLLFWRASTHWVGGVGVVLFALVILPSVGRTKMTLSNVEMSSLARDNFRYTTKKLFKIILLVYGGLTLLETVLLCFAGMNWFDAVTHSFSTMATGGFSTKNLSVKYFDSLSIEMIIMVFMFIAGMHLGLIYASIKGKHNNFFHSEVWRFYAFSVMVAITCVSLNLWAFNVFPDFWSSLRYGSFQVVSYTSTTGFASSDAAYWPAFSILIMIYMSIQCSMAGSTSGGVKVDRVVLLLKSLRARILKLQHPNAVIRVRLGGITQEDSTVNTAVLLIAFYILVLFISTVVLTLFNLDLSTSFTA